jgi:hypothetical protein
MVCALLSAGAFFAVGSVRGTISVVFADLSLIALVLLFRAMKLNDFSQHTPRSRVLMAVLLGFGVVCALVGRTH